MKKDADMHDAEDKKKKELIEVRNTADQAIYTAEKAMREDKEKLSAELVSAVEAKISTLRASKDKDDMAVIKSDTEALSTELAKVHDEVAKAGVSAAGAGAQAEPGAQGGAGEGPKDDNIRDAEVK